MRAFLSASPTRIRGLVQLTVAEAQLLRDAQRHAERSRSSPTR